MKEQKDIYLVQSENSVLGSLNLIDEFLSNIEFERIGKKMC